MLQNLTYSYLVSWLSGGLMLVTILVLRTQRRPFSLSFALLGYGAAGFLALGFGLGAWNLTLLYATLAGAVGAALGYWVRPRRPQSPAEVQA